jgi:peptidoglycan/LPS O-acetylase OafA/YrhL
MKDDLPTLTGIRGLAAVAIVLHHYRVPGFEVGWLAVDVFFVLSGFVLSHVYRDGVSRGTFLWARFARTWPTHLVATTMVGAVMIAYQVMPSAGFGHLVANLLLVGLLVGPTWSLIVEWYAYLLMAAFGPLPAARRVPGWATLAIGAAVGLAGVALGGAGPVFDLGHVARGLGWFLAGIGLYRLGWRPRRVWLLDNRFALWLGAVSYPLYLVHELPGFMLGYGLGASGAVQALAGIPTAVGLAVALHCTIEDPARRWLRRFNVKLTESSVKSTVDHVHALPSIGGASTWRQHMGARMRSAGGTFSWCRPHFGSGTGS